MINHARTLLLNTASGPAGYDGNPGDEYIDPQYRPITSMPGYLQDLRRLLFGSDNPDRIYRNYRVQQLLAVLHATDMLHYITGLDSRYTYDVSSPQILSSFGVAAPSDITVIAGTDDPDSNGCCRQQWVLATTPTGVDVLPILEEGDYAETGIVHVERRTSPTVSHYARYAIADGLSTLIAMPGSNRRVRIAGNAVAALLGKTWTITAIDKPVRDIGEIVASIVSHASQHMNQLFGIGDLEGSQEPLTTFRTLWTTHPATAWRLSGLLGALIYRMEQLRKAAI